MEETQELSHNLQYPKVYYLLHNNLPLVCILSCTYPIHVLPPCIFMVRFINKLNSVSIFAQQDVTIYSFIIFLQTALHVSDDTLIHHQEHIQTVITTSGTGRTVFATVR